MKRDRVASCYMSLDHTASLCIGFAAGAPQTHITTKMARKKHSKRGEDGRWYWYPTEHGRGEGLVPAPTTASVLESPNAWETSQLAHAEKVIQTVCNMEAGLMNQSEIIAYNDHLQTLEK